jgi:hypothetical protein
VQRIFVTFNVHDILSQVSSVVNDRFFDILVHPRVPPLVRSLPHIEPLSLFRAEESQEEIDARESLGLEVMDQNIPSINQDIAMEEQPSDTITSSFVPSTPVKALGDHPPLAALMTVADVDQESFDPVSMSTAPLSPPQPLLPSTAVRQSTPKQTAISFVEENEEDEEIPAIDIDSDSD